MIIVHGTFPVNPEHRDQALELMRKMSMATSAEPGCISYEFFIGLSDPDTMLLYQEWDSVEALQDHFETRHMEEFLGNLPDVLNGKVMTKRYEVRGAHELMDEPRYKESKRTPKIIH